MENKEEKKSGLEMSFYGCLNDQNVWVPLPKEQQLTKESLLDLEREAAKSARRHDAEAVLLAYYASQFLPCLGGGPISTTDEDEKGNSHTRR